MTILQKELSIAEGFHLAKTFLPFILLFGIIKYATLMGGIWMAQLVNDISDYGLFEYAFTAGIFLSIPLNVGMQGAYPHFILEQKKEQYGVIFDVHAFLLTSVLLLLIFLNYLLGVWEYVLFNLSIILGGIIALQILSSVICKSKELVYKAVLLEGGLFLIVNAYNLWVFLTGMDYDFLILQLGCLLYLFGFWCWYGYQFYRNREDFLWKNYRAVFRFGRSIVLSSILFIALTGGGKLLVGHFLGMEAVGYYAYYLRFASVLYLAFQAFNIFFFKKVYQAKTKVLDRYFTTYLFFLSLLGLLLGILLPVVFPGLLLPFKDANRYLPLFFLLLCQVVFWIHTALNEIIIYREGLSVQMNKRIALLLACSIWAVYLVHQLHFLNLTLFILLNIGSLFIAAEIQSRLLLQQKQIDLYYVRSVSRVLFFLVLIGILINYSF